MKHTFALCIFLAAVPALAEPAKPVAHHNASEPINVSSDNFTAEKSPAQAGGGVVNGTYSGNVVIVQGDMRMRADTVRILVVEGHAEKAFANGHIVIDSPNSGTATGDTGVYDIGPRIATLTGHVILTKEKNVMRGQQLTVNLVTGVANLGSVTGSHGGRVQGIFTPPPQGKSP
ncbi:MAG TPA: LptA/OstA family protein [Rhizomicrobium sp.]|nr:LptA/OstA family protein [Rhizomicrobium sp.]